MNFIKKYCYFHVTDWCLIVKLENQKVMAFVNTKTRRQPWVLWEIWMDMNWMEEPCEWIALPRKRTGKKWKVRRVQIVPTETDFDNIIVMISSICPWKSCRKTHFEPTWAVFWSPPCYKELKLTIQPFTGRTCHGFLIQMLRWKEM